MTTKYVVWNARAIIDEEDFEDLFEYFEASTRYISRKDWVNEYCTEADLYGLDEDEMSELYENFYNECFEDFLALDCATIKM